MPWLARKFDELFTEEEYEEHLSEEEDLEEDGIAIRLFQFQPPSRG